MTTSTKKFDQQQAVNDQSREDSMVKEQELEVIIQNIKKMLCSMKYGSITLIVQDGKVIQLEKNEKVRIK